MIQSISHWAKPPGFPLKSSSLKFSAGVPKQDALVLDCDETAILWEDYNRVANKKRVSSLCAYLNKIKERTLIILNTARSRCELKEIVPVIHADCFPVDWLVTNNGTSLYRNRTDKSLAPWLTEVVEEETDWKNRVIERGWDVGRLTTTIQDVLQDAGLAPLPGMQDPHYSHTLYQGSDKLGPLVLYYPDKPGIGLGFAPEAFTARSQFSREQVEILAKKVIEKSTAQGYALEYGIFAYRFSLPEGRLNSFYCMFRPTNVTINKASPLAHILQRNKKVKRVIGAGDGFPDMAFLSKPVINVTDKRKVPVHSIVCYKQPEDITAWMQRILRGPQKHPRAIGLALRANTLESCIQGILETPEIPGE